jgi:hypothetical protein
VKVGAKNLGRILLLLILSVVVTFNSLYIKSWVVGLPLSIAFFFVVSTAVGEVFFLQEKRFFRVTLGFATFFTLTALFGSILIISAEFTQFLSLVMVSVIGLVFSVLPLRTKGTYEERSLGPKATEKLGGNLPLYLATGAFVVCVAVAFHALAVARTDEGITSVWLTIPGYFLPVFFFCSLILMFILFFTRMNVGLKLSLIFIYSFLARSLFWIVWYPGRYGDPWQLLGSARFIDRTGMPYAYSWMLKNFLVIDLIKYKAQYAPIVLVTRMFNVDIYWVHILFIPFLWSFLVPLFSYKFAEMLAKGRSEQFPLLAALVAGLFPSLVLWGTVSVSNSVGFIFFFFVVFLMFYWVRTGKRQVLVLSLLVITATFFAHILPAIFAFMFFLLVVVFQKFSRAIEKVVFCLLLFLLYPLALYLSGAQFSLNALFTLESFGSLQSDIVTAMTLFGLLGLLLSLRSRYVERRNILLVFAFYGMIVLEYYLSKYGMSNLPYGAHRVLPMADFLFLPFVALGVIEVVNILARVFSHVNPIASSFKRVNSRFLPRSVGFALICLVLSAQAILVLNEAYPRQEGTDIQPAVYMMEAIYYINSTAPGPYVVLCDTQLANLAIGLLGMDYGYAGGRYGLFGMPEFNYPTIQMYGRMRDSPSISIMQQAINFTGWAKVAYYVLSVIAGAKFKTALEKTKEILPVDAVFGDGKLYVFKYPIPITEEPGPQVKVVFDDGVSTEYAETKLQYFFEKEINSTLTLSGHTSYNITEYPMHWTFLDLRVNNVSRPFDEASDINTFVYVKGLKADDVLTVKWQWNRKYSSAVWKDDSFKSGWRTHDLYRGTLIPTITNDGNILSMSYSFTPGPYLYYYYIKAVNISTTENQCIMVRWKCDGSVAAVAFYSELGLARGFEVVRVGSVSTDWTVTTFELPSNMWVTYVLVGINNISAKDTSGMKTLSVDYILISTSA